MESKLIHRRWFLYLTEFFAGMSVMAVELGTSRRRADPPAPGRHPSDKHEKGASPLGWLLFSSDAHARGRVSPSRLIWRSVPSAIS